jgi:mono/diheme cytochrome c family protein
MTDWLTSWKDARPGRSYTEAPTAVKRGDGEYLYRSLCAGCHSVGQGDKVGPDLARALETHDRAWLAEYTLRPDVVRAKKDPIAMMLASRYREVRMPKLDLTAAEVQSILGYIDTLRVHGAASTHASSQTSASPRATARPTTTALTDAALALHTALAHETLAGVSTHAAALRDAAIAANDRAVAAAAVELARQTNIADARRAFGAVSDALVAYARSHTEVRTAGVRAAYCPMLRKSWLQQDGPVQNPYYGRRMLACGEFTN